MAQLPVLNREQREKAYLLEMQIQRGVDKMFDSQQDDEEKGILKELNKCKCKARGKYIKSYDMAGEARHWVECTHIIKKHSSAMYYTKAEAVEAWNS